MVGDAGQVALALAVGLSYGADRSQGVGSVWTGTRATTSRPFAVPSWRSKSLAASPPGQYGLRYGLVLSLAGLAMLPLACRS